MSRSDVKLILDRVDSLVQEIGLFVPNTPSSIQFRADIAGLLVVAIASSYEACVKETLTNFASQQHGGFGAFIQNQYSRLNSRIQPKDLYGYTKMFDISIHKRFSERMAIRRSRIKSLLGRDIEKEYLQILSWRHDFAHAGIRNTTIEEAFRTHKLARGVLHAFDEAFTIV